MEQQPSKGKAIGLSIPALALGIAAFTPYVGWIFAIVALIFAKKALPECEAVGFPTGMAKGGKICAIIGLIFGIVFTIILIVGIIAAATAAPYYSYPY
ncbi:MAG: hypothetical protein FWF10_04705 [Clostridiales bacterium]|nr:hypothetical protein [Clostridiales bacterium]